jgi:hypothetical protein
MDGPAQTVENAIELRIEEISQLFHSLDPFPFREKDLDKETEEFIVGWARELSVDRQIKIVVHLPEAQASTPEAQEIRTTIRRYFEYRARVAVLSFSTIVGQTLAASLSPPPVSRVIEESLLIFGWVANWRPLQIFLYECWPIVRRRNLHWRLSQAQVNLRPHKSNPAASAI